MPETECRLIQLRDTNTRFIVVVQIETSSVPVRIKHDERDCA